MVDSRSTTPPCNAEVVKHPALVKPATSPTPEPQDQPSIVAPTLEQASGSRMSASGDEASTTPPVASRAPSEHRQGSRALSRDAKQDEQTLSGRGTPSTPMQLPDYDWNDFTARFEAALKEADEREGDLSKEAEALSTYFRAWASAASVHDNERAVKRLQTRKRFVNLSEERMAQKQQHYEEVFKAFESALALLRSH